MSQFNITPLQYPINGIDLADGGTDSSIATCNDALNVRSRSAMTKRVQGGKRAGLVKLLTAMAGTTGSRRITGLAAMQRPAQSLSALQLIRVEVADDMSQNDGSYWALNRYFAFRKASFGQATYFAASHGNLWNMSLASGVPKVIEIINTRRLIASTVPGPTKVDSGIVIDGATGNDVSITFRGRRALNYTAATAGNPDLNPRSSDSYECSDCGPFINASEDLIEHYYAYIHVSAANQFEFRLSKILKVAGTPTETVLQVSDTLQSGSSNAVDTADSATIRIWSNSAKVYAQLDWPAAGLAPPILENDIEPTLTGNRAGILNTRDTEGCSRSIFQTRYKRLVEPSRKTFWSIDGSMDMPGQATQPLYACPPDTRSWLARNGTDQNIQNNDPNTWTTDVAEPSRPYLNSVSGWITSHVNAALGTSASGATTWPCITTSKTFDTTKTYAAEFKFDWNRSRALGATVTTAPAQTANRDEVTVLMRVDNTSATRNRGLAFSMRRKFLGRGTLNTNPNRSSDHFLEWCLYEFDLANGLPGPATRRIIKQGFGFSDSWLVAYGTAGAGGDIGHPLNAGALANNAATIFNVNDWIRVTDKDSTVTISQNGCTLLTIPTTTTGGAVANATIGVGNTTLQRTGYGFCILPQEAATGQSRDSFGVLTSPNSDAGGTPRTYRTKCNGLRIVDITQASTDPTPDVGEYDLLIVAGSQPHLAQVKITDTVRSVGSEQLVGQQQITAVYGGQFYVVDGTNSVVVHPVKREVKQYIATDGIFPAGCEIIATYRARIVLARQSGNPTLWFMSRAGKPQDFDFGSAVDTSSKAYFGATGAIGQPSDPITALAPFMDDYLIIGCQSSLYIMEGDPGTGGRLQSLNNRIGIVGPRAWCFDEIGTLYFVGPGGLYKLDRGTRQPVPVTGRKLAGMLDTIDTSTTLVQCGYDGQSECVHVFLTPLAGVGSPLPQHVVYEIPTRALWLDEYPNGQEPWAVCEIDGPTGQSRRILFGGNDGYIRRFSESALSDDGSAITSRIRFAPLTSNSAASEMIVTELEAIGPPNANNGALNWYIIAEDSDDACEAQTLAGAKLSGTWANMSKGWQTPVGMRIANTAVQVALQQISSTQSWACTKVNLKLETTGKNRKPVAP